MDPGYIGTVAQVGVAGAVANIAWHNFKPKRKLPLNEQQFKDHVPTQDEPHAEP